VNLSAAVGKNPEKRNIHGLTVCAVFIDEHCHWLTDRCSRMLFCKFGEHSKLCIFLFYGGVAYVKATFLA